MIWGSDSVIKKWSKFRQLSSDPDKVKTTYQSMILLENLLKEIRKDIGYNGGKLDEGELLGLFINDIKKELRLAKEK